MDEDNIFQYTSSAHTIAAVFEEEQNRNNGRNVSLPLKAQSINIYREAFDKRFEKAFLSSRIRFTNIFGEMFRTDIPNATLNLNIDLLEHDEVI